MIIVPALLNKEQKKKKKSLTPDHTILTLSRYFYYSLLGDLPCTVNIFADKANPTPLGALCLSLNNDLQRF